MDIFSRPDGTFGFEEFRRDPEDMGAWTPIAYYSGREFLSEADAIAAARAVACGPDGPRWCRALDGMLAIGHHHALVVPLLSVGGRLARSAIRRSRCLLRGRGRGCR